MIKFGLKGNFKRIKGKLYLKILLTLIAYFVQFNKLFQKKYYYNGKTKTFDRLKPKLTDLTVEQVIFNGRHETHREYYDDNLL